MIVSHYNQELETLQSVHMMLDWKQCKYCSEFEFSACVQYCSVLGKFQSTQSGVSFRRFHKNGSLRPRLKFEICEPNSSLPVDAVSSYLVIILKRESGYTTQEG